MRRGEILEHFLLGYGLQIQSERGRPANIGGLLAEVQREHPDCNDNELLDALYNLSPENAKVDKFVKDESRFIAFDRSDPAWKDFFYTGYFHIKTLPPGRLRFEKLSEELKRESAPEKSVSVPAIRTESKERSSAFAQEPQSSIDPRKVFVVHGRDEHWRKDFFEFLQTIGLTPLEWSEAIRLTGKGSPYIGEVLDSAFAHAQAIVVLLTPDDEVRLSPELILGTDGPAEKEYRLQARPNVLFEAGLGFGRSPDRTILVEVGSPKPFSDVAGRHAVRLSNDESRRRDLMERLKTAGCNVKPKDERWKTVGHFEISRALQSSSSGQSVYAAPVIETEPSVKWVDLNYPRDSGLLKQLQAEGYTVRWSLDTELARRLDIDRWTLVTKPESGREVILKMKDRPADQTLIKKKVGNGTTAPRPNLQYVTSKEKPVFISPFAFGGISDPRDSEERGKSLQALVLKFENRPLNDQTIARALNVIAKIRFRSKDGVRQRVDYGVWLNSACNSTDMEVGDTRELVLMCVMDDKLITFEDRREENHHFHDEFSYIDDPDVSGLEMVEVTLIDKKTQTTLNCNFRALLDGARFCVA